MRAFRLSRLLVIGALAAVGAVVPSTAAQAAAPLVITTTAIPDATVGTAYTATLKATGGTLFKTWSVSDGALPAGLKLSPQGRISGTPQVDGSASFTVTVKDTANHSTTASFAVDVLPMHISTASLPTATLGAKYRVQLAALGGTKPYTWSLEAGDLPGSITLSSAGLLSGYPGVFDLGLHQGITIRVTDKAGRTDVRTYDLLSQNMQITTTSVPAAKKGKYYSTRFKFYGGCAVPSWDVTDVTGTSHSLGRGILPDGLVIAARSGVISGVPKVTGTYQFRVFADCNNGPFSPYDYSDVLTLTVS